MKFRVIILVAVLFSICGIGCKKLITVSAPPTSVTGTDAYTTDATAIGVVTGIYANTSNSSPTNAGSIPSLTLFCGLSSDELTLWSGVSNLMASAYFTNNLTGGSQGYGSEFWDMLYPFIYSCNSAIQGLNSAASLTPAVKTQLLGEAKFMRAFYYFYLVNLYGDVPLALTNDYKVNAGLTRTATTEVNEQIVSDLHDAQRLLSANYLDGSLLATTADRVRPTSWAATALLARVYLYSQNWAGADSASSVLINNSSLFSLSSLDSTFLRASLNNYEAIWQLQPVTSSPQPTNTQDALVFTIPATGLGTAGNFGAYLSNYLIQSFEPGDKRMSVWVDSAVVSGVSFYYPFKYKVNSTDPNTPITEELMMLRLGEQYLIRAEARANEGNIAGAKSDLNAIRLRAGLSETTASTQTELASAILHERDVELFAELGHRWLDLKRTGNVDSTMNVVTPQKGWMWHSYQQLYPIPFTDIQADPNLKQNEGY